MNRILVIGSGAGGAVTALELAQKGLDVMVVEEGQKEDHDHYSSGSTEAMARLYRKRGMTPIMGRVPVGYVEGCCYGGSTEINSGFWHRTPPEILLRWRALFELDRSTPEDLRPHFEWAEEQLKVGFYGRVWPESTNVVNRGVEAMGWSADEIPRVGAFSPPGGETIDARLSMSRSLLPKAEGAGVHVLTGCRARLLLKKGRRITGLLASLRHQDGTEELIRIDADTVFICTGATETPALLQRSGIPLNIGNSFRIHPMLKVVARFEEPLDAQESVMPLIQVKEFWPDISMGGSFFNPGHLAMLLSENWPEHGSLMDQYRHMASYYVAAKGNGRGSVRSSLLGRDSTSVRYQISREDIRHLSTGLARLSMVLLAGGAKAVYPSVNGLPAIHNEIEAVRWLDDLLPGSALSLATVHAFSTCPMGERRDRCAADSYGKVHHFENLYVNDASMLPDSPGVNPQGTIMAFARRNALHFVEEGL